MGKAKKTEQNIDTGILISGFGGQGIMRLGKILAGSALAENRNATDFPSYGAEMRGGTAHCFVKISDIPIGSPFVDEPDISVIFNQPSLDRFGEKIKKDGIVILNTDLVSRNPAGLKTETFSFPFNKIALGCGSVKTANIAALGVLVAAADGILQKATVVKNLKRIFKGSGILEQNLNALSEGIRLGKAARSGGKYREYERKGAWKK